ncbi:sensor histidine kinase [Bacillus canaveralius]|nr:HAMP domain-containing sensor histidine kinase [Bacillus canaveralius]
MLLNISAHVHEEINQQLSEGTPFKEVQVSIDELSISEIAIMVKSKTGALIEANSHPFFKDRRIMNENQVIDPVNFKTITDSDGVRIRVHTASVHQKGEVVGYIEMLYSLRTLDNSLLRFKWIVIGFTGVGIFLAAIAGWFLAKKTLSRVDLIGRTAKAIASSQDFQQRVLHVGPADELGKLTETFNQMLDSLEKAYTNQKRFLSDASHELRAPLTSIRGNLDILHKIKNIPEAEKEEMLNDIRSESIRMSKLVSDLLSLARAEAGQLFNMETINLSSLITVVIEEMETWKKAVNVEASIEDDLYIWGSSDAIKQLLIILLDNAIKYTHPGGSVFVSLETANDQATIKIKDTGIGIEKEELPFIFERFYRTPSARKHTPDGTGLGLAIAKWIVDEHNGSLVLTSQSGEGSEFIVCFSVIK